MVFSASSTTAWVKGTAMYQGQPFEAHLSLTDVQFGASGEDSQTVCGFYGKCSLSFMCDRTDIPVDEIYGNNFPKYTPPEGWCRARTAGASTLSLLWLGFIPGAIATGLTLAYAAKQIDQVGKLFLQAEKKGFSDKIQKMIISGCWVGYWAFLFFAMTSFAAVHPASLGWSTNTLQSSFGLLRFAFFMVSIFASLLIASFFELWHTDNVVEAWAEFEQTPWMSAKKLLYMLLMIQAGLYLVYTIEEVDWALLLIIIAGYYLDAKKRNFMLMYLVLVSVTLLLDVLKIATTTGEQKTPGEAFGSFIFFLIFCLKFGIVGAIYMYQKQEDLNPTAFAFSHMPDDRGRDNFDPEEIAQ